MKKISWKEKNFFLNSFIQKVFLYFWMTLILKDFKAFVILFQIPFVIKSVKEAKKEKNS